MLADAATLVLLAAGVACFAIAAVGVMRLPDALSRLHAVAKADSLGLAFVVAALALQASGPAVVAELALVWVLVVAASVLACYALARGLTGEGGDGRG